MPVLVTKEATFSLLDKNKNWSLSDNELKCSLKRKASFTKTCLKSQYKGQLHEIHLQQVNYS